MTTYVRSRNPLRRLWGALVCHPDHDWQRVLARHEIVPVIPYDEAEETTILDRCRHCNLERQVITCRVIVQTVPLRVQEIHS